MPLLCSTKKRHKIRIHPRLTDRIPAIQRQNTALSGIFDERWQVYAADPTHQAAQRRADGVLNPQEQVIREEILSGLLADKGGVAQISSAIRVLAEIIASNLSLLVTFNHAIENNPKARANPKALAQLDGYNRPLVSSLQVIFSGSEWRQLRSSKARRKSFD